MAKDNSTKEPWEKSIYDTDYEPTQSRKSQRQVKKGNTRFLTILVILLVIIIGSPISAWLWSTKHRGTNNSGVSTPPSTVQPSTSTQKSETSKKESSKESSKQSSSSSEESTTKTSDSNESQGKEETEVLAGEGLAQIAERTGVSEKTIAELNGITINADGSFTPAIHPGQKLRVK